MKGNPDTNYMERFMEIEAEIIMAKVELSKTAFLLLSVEIDELMMQLTYIR